MWPQNISIVKDTINHPPSTYFIDNVALASKPNTTLLVSEHDGPSFIDFRSSFIQLNQEGI